MSVFCVILDYDFLKIHILPQLRVIYIASGMLNCGPPHFELNLPTSLCCFTFPVWILIEILLSSFWGYTFWVTDCAAEEKLREKVLLEFFCLLLHSEKRASEIASLWSGPTRDGLWFVFWVSISCWGKPVASKVWLERLCFS